VRVDVATLGIAASLLLTFVGVWFTERDAGHTTPYDTGYGSKPEGPVERYFGKGSPFAGRLADVLWA